MYAHLYVNLLKERHKIMISWKQVADVMFSNIQKTPEDYETIYPARDLPEGARVTRVAPSPTGYLHLGVFYSALIDRLTAYASKGIFYFRLEDTDKKREVEGGANDILSSLNQFGLPIDEGFIGPDTIIGEYGPYVQSQRGEIYQTYVKQLVASELAYPCFCSAEENAAVREQQEAKKEKTGYYGKYAKCRNLTAEDALNRIQSGESYVVRLRSPGSEEHRIKFDDMIKGTVEMPENDEDFVLLKSDGIPTYHFAHAIDDHLMHTTHVIRGDEWLSSVPKHIQLFKILGFKIPKFCHISPIMVEEDGHKRKLSKRKDPQAAMHFYAEQGYPAESVVEYLMTIASSEFEQWRKANPKVEWKDFPFNIKKMSVSGALFDLKKMNDVSKNVIAGMSTEKVLKDILAWAKEYNQEFYNLLTADLEYAKNIFAIDRDNPKPRKDMAKWSDAPEYAAYFFDSTFDEKFELPENIQAEDAKNIIDAYVSSYQPISDQSEWFAKVKGMCEGLGFCPDVKEYKKNPDMYKGHVGDLSTVLRLAVTGRRNTPDLCRIMEMLGEERVLKRLQNASSTL